MADDMQDLKMSAAFIVKKTREDLGLSQAQLAYLLGIGDGKDGSKVSRVESGERKPNGVEVVAYVAMKLLENPGADRPDLAVTPSEIVHALEGVDIPRRSEFTAAMALNRHAYERGRLEAVDKTLGLNVPPNSTDEGVRSGSMLGLKEHIDDIRVSVRAHGARVGGRAGDKYDLAAGLAAQLAEVLDQAREAEEQERKDPGGGGET